MFNFEKTERSILAGAILILLACSYFLYDDSLLFSSRSDSANELIGSVADSTNDVRLKNSDNFSWLPAIAEGKVYQKDSVFTGDQSKATIRLKDGSLIEIQPNSLVTLNLQNGQMNLDLRYGNLVGELTAGSKLTVTSGKEEFKLNGDGSQSRIEFSKGRTGAMDLTLLSGKSGSVTKNGKTLAVKPAIKPELFAQFPVNKYVAKPDESHPIEFLWSSRGPVSTYEVEISDTFDFQKILRSERTTKRKLNVAGLPEGQYYWRVSGYDDKKELGARTPSTTFSLRYLPTPQITMPAPESRFDLQIRPPAELKTDTKVSWEGAKAFNRFRFQVAADPEFKTPLKDVETPAQESMTPALASGTYYVRVRGVESQNNLSSEWSTPVKFELSLTQQEEDKLAAPILVKKNIVFRMPKPGERAPAALAAPVMEWKPVLRAKKYKLQISPDRDFKRTADFEVNRTQSAWSQVRPGEYYYRVFTIGDGGRTSPPSQLGQLQVNGQEPILNAIAPIKLRKSPGMDQAPERDFKVSWTPVPEAKSYLLEMVPEKDPTHPQRLEFAGTGGDVKIADPGKYKVRVKALNAQNKSISDFSNPQQALYLFDQGFDPPVPREPFNQASIFLQQELSPFIWLEWKSVTGAVTYRVEVSATPDFQTPLITTTVGESRFLIKNKVPLGKVYWRVRAESTNEALESDWSQPREFSIYHKKNETFVK